MCLPKFIKIGHYLEVAHTGVCFINTHNFGENNIYACVCNKTCTKPELGWNKWNKAEETCKVNYYYDSDCLNCYLLSHNVLYHQCPDPVFRTVDLAHAGYCFLCLSTSHRRYCFCSSFLVRDELYCCIKAMALSALSFTTFIFYAAVLRSWYERSVSARYSQGPL